MVSFSLQRRISIAFFFASTAVINLWTTCKILSQLNGYTKEEVIGKDLHKLIVPERFYEDYFKGLEKFKKSGTDGIIGKIISMHGF
jgi:hypothetical protein